MERACLSSVVSHLGFRGVFGAHRVRRSPSWAQSLRRARLCVRAWPLRRGRSAALSLCVSYVPYLERRSRCHIGAA
eukprot:11172654-Alexandrium_andersonii.AAC.1